MTDALQYGAMGLLALVLVGAGRLLAGLLARIDRIEDALVRMTCAVLLAAHIPPEELDRIAGPAVPRAQGGTAMQKIRSLLALLVLLLCSGMAGACVGGMRLPRVDCSLGGDVAPSAPASASVVGASLVREQPAQPAPAAAAPTFIIIKGDGEVVRPAQPAPPPAPPVALQDVPGLTRRAPAAEDPPAGRVEDAAPWWCTGGLCRVP